MPPRGVVRASPPRRTLPRRAAREHAAELLDVLNRDGDDVNTPHNDDRAPVQHGTNTIRWMVGRRARPAARGGAASAAKQLLRLRGISGQIAARMNRGGYDKRAAVMHRDDAVYVTQVYNVDVGGIDVHRSDDGMTTYGSLHLPIDLLLSRAWAPYAKRRKPRDAVDDRALAARVILEKHVLSGRSNEELSHTVGIGIDVGSLRNTIACDPIADDLLRQMSNLTVEIGMGMTIKPEPDGTRRHVFLGEAWNAGSPRADIVASDGSNVVGVWFYICGGVSYANDLVKVLDMMADLARSSCAIFAHSVYDTCKKIADSCIANSITLLFEVNDIDGVEFKRISDIAIVNAMYGHVGGDTFDDAVSNAMQGLFFCNNHRCKDFRPPQDPTVQEGNVHCKDCGGFLKKISDVGASNDKFTRTSFPGLERKLYEIRREFGSSRPGTCLAYASCGRVLGVCAVAQ